MERRREGTRDGSARKAQRDKTRAAVSAPVQRVSSRLPGYENNPLMLRHTRTWKLRALNDRSILTDHVTEGDASIFFKSQVARGTSDPLLPRIFSLLHAATENGHGFEAPKGSHRRPPLRGERGKREKREREIEREREGEGSIYEMLIDRRGLFSGCRVYSALPAELPGRAWRVASG